MVQFVMTRMFSPGVERTNILRTTSLFIAFSGKAEYFSCVPSVCSKMSDIYFHTDVTLADASTLQGGELPSIP